MTPTLPIFEKTNGRGDNPAVFLAIDANIGSVLRKPFVNLGVKQTDVTLTYTDNSIIAYNVDEVIIYIDGIKRTVGVAPNINGLVAMLNTVLDIAIFYVNGSGKITAKGFHTFGDIVKSVDGSDVVLFTAGSSLSGTNQPTSGDIFRELALRTIDSSDPFSSSPQLANTVFAAPSSGTGIPSFRLFSFTQLYDTFSLAGNAGRIPMVDSDEGSLFPVSILNPNPIFVDAASNNSLPVYTYSNGTSGVGAFIRINAFGVFPNVDGVPMTLGKKFLFKNGTSAAHNGLYVITTEGDGSTLAKATRMTNSDTPSELYPQYVVAKFGSNNAKNLYQQQTTAPTVGSSSIVYAIYGTSASSSSGWLPDGNAFGAAKKIGNTDNFGLSIITNNVARITILNTGLMGFGQATPTATVHITGITSASPLFVENQAQTHSFEYRNDGSIRRDTIPYSTIFGTDTTWGQNSGRVLVTPALNTLMGYRSGFNMADTAARNSFYGGSSGNTTTTGTDLVLIGANTDVIGATTSFSIAIGSGAVVNASNQMVIGSATAPIQTIYVGIGESTSNSALPTEVAISGTRVTGANRSAALSILSFNCATGSGTGDTGNIVWKYALPIASSGTSNTLIEGMRFVGNTGQLIIGSTAAPVTTGLVKLQNTGGAPQFFVSNASPEGVITASRGSVCYVDTGSVGAQYNKTSGTGNTGWVIVGTGGGTGTVTSVILDYTDASVSSIFDVSGGNTQTISTTGTFAITLNTQTTNKVFAAPNGGTGVPTFRLLVAADIPDLSGTYQPLDSDLTAIAALSTASFGRGALTQVDAAGFRTYIGTGTGTGDALTSNPLSQFAATTSAQLRGVISDETGAGLSVFNDTPTLITPVLGVATATSINKVVITAPAASATLTIANTKTLTVNNTITFAGTDSTVMTFPGASDTVATLAAVQTFITGAKTFNSSILKIRNPADTFSTTIVGGAIAADENLSIPVLTGNRTMAVIDQAQTWTAVQTYGTALLNIADISDANGAKSLAVSATSSAVDYFTIVNAATGSPATIKLQATGSDSNINTLFSPKGIGKFQISDGTDLSKILAFDLSGGTTAITGTFAWSPTTAKTMTFQNVTDTVAVLGTVQTFSASTTFTAATVFSSSITINTNSLTFRTSNGGSNIIATMMLDPSGSQTAGTSFSWDATNFRAGINIGNGTRRIQVAAYGLTNTTTTAGSEASDLAFYTMTGGVAAVERFRITAAGGLVINTTTTTVGTTGNQTINKPSGTVNIAAGGTTVTVTNSLVTSASLVHVFLRTVDTTAKSAVVVANSGNFVVTLDAAATSEVSIGFTVFN